MHIINQFDFDENKQMSLNKIPYPAQNPPPSPTSTIMSDQLFSYNKQENRHDMESSHVGQNESTSFQHDFTFAID